MRATLALAVAAIIITATVAASFTLSDSTASPPDCNELILKALEITSRPDYDFNDYHREGEAGPVMPESCEKSGEALPGDHHPSDAGY